ncbi:hypothetical protein G6F35_011927 [Rhizopus arrhizus]|nr:hypothetical protein G6F35_011927 [Rhizopus arrhizus]
MRLRAHAFNAQQQHHAEGDHQYGEANTQRAAAQAGPGKLKHGRLQAIVVADHHHRGTGRLALCGHQLQEGCGGIPVQRRGRFIGQQHRRPANQRTSGRHALLLADTQGARAPLHQRRVQLQGAQQSRDLGVQRPADALAAQAREAQAQRNVVAHAEERQQVELLEDHAQVVGAEAVAAGAAHGLQRLPGHLDAALAGQQHPGQQSQQRALAATTDAAQQHAAALLDPQLRNVQHQAQPIAELHLIQPDQRSAAHGASRGIPPAAASPARAMPLDWHSGTAGWR